MCSVKALAKETSNQHMSNISEQHMSNIWFKDCLLDDIDKEGG
ncbi:hypothetical protein Hamer_G019814 [Homarus americanus]|uniref:Uncharacterized protein n=1 Tax=Homarus americanus TaxID=6706 RepID=A0A8J5J753_HOMAM|nr:hypothetical protein Hamer_G019814 [Homarus americanus]